MWHPQPLEVIKEWIDSIIKEASDELSDWEMEFVESVQKRNNKGQDLTEKQQDILERIYAEKTS